METISGNADSTIDLKNRGQNSQVGILYYHQILSGWGSDVYWKTFDRQMQLSKFFFDIIPLDECIGIMRDSTVKLKRPAIAITFDDGYLDTWVYAYPILKKHKIRATLFALPSRIIKSAQVRPTLIDYWNGKCDASQLLKSKPLAEYQGKFITNKSEDGFLCEEEIRQMADVIDIQCHGDIHARVFSEDRLLDIYDGSGHWSLPYSFGEKPYRGLPLFPTESNLAVQRGDLRQDVRLYVKNLDQSFFLRPDWKKQLSDSLQKQFSSMLQFETAEQRIERITKELTDSKKDLETITGKKVEIFSYPFGHFDDTLCRITSQLFSGSCTTAKPDFSKSFDSERIPRYKIHKDIWSYINTIKKILFGRK